MIGELINCLSMTRDGRCARCAVCRIVMAIENIHIDVNVERNRALNVSLDTINDTLEEIATKIEYIGDGL